MTDIVDDVLREVSRRFDVSADEIRSTRRTRKILPARHVAAYLAHKLSGLSSAEIGARLGGREYTNIEMYCRGVQRRTTEDEAFKHIVLELEGIIRGCAD